MSAGQKTRAEKRGVEVVHYSVGEGDYRDVSSYDERRYIGAANLYKQTVMSNTYKRLLGPLERKRILDVGCGTGRGMIDLAEHAKLAVGCDASEDMLRTARRKINGRPNCRLVRGYAQFLPFSDKSFDVIVSLNFLHLFSLATQRAMVTEMKRVVKPGGHMVLEFDNALHGLCVGLYKRWFREERGVLPREIRFILGDDCKVENVSGAVFPIVWRLLYRIPRVSIPLEKISFYWPMSRLAHRIYYKIRKW